MDITIKRLSIVLIILIAIAAIPYAAEYLGITQSNTLLFDANEDPILAVHIMQHNDESEEAIDLTSENGTWYVNGFPVAADRIDLFLSQLSPLFFESIASDNTANHVTFHVDTDQATLIVMKTAGQDIRLHVGKTAIGTSAFYVRFNNSDEVYLVKNQIRILATGSVGDWRDKTILSIDEPALQSFTTSYNGNEVLHARNETAEWGSEAIESAAKRLANLTGTGFADEDVVSELPSNPTATIIVEHDNGSSTLNLYSHNDLWFAALDQDPTVFTLSQYMVDEMLVE